MTTELGTASLLSILLSYEQAYKDIQSAFIVTLKAYGFPATC